MSNSVNLANSGNAQQAVKIPQEIWTLVAAAFCIALGYGIVAPIIPQFARSFDVGMAAAGLVVSIFAFSRLACAPVSGRLVDALGSRRVYLSGLVTVAITTALVSLAGAYWQILTLRALAGIGSTMFTVSAMGLIVKLAPPMIRGKCSSAYASGFLIGNIIGPVMGAALSVIGMRWPFVIYGCTVLFAAAVVSIRMPKGGQGVPHIGTPGGQDTEGRIQVEFPRMTFREAFAHAAYRCALVSGFANGWSNFGVRVAVVPLLAADIFHRGEAMAGLAMAAFAAGSACALQFSGRIADRIGRRPVVLSGLVVNALATATFGFSSTAWALLVLSVIAGMGAGTLNPAQQAVVADVIGQHRSGGRVLANFQMAQDSGSILGPIVVGATSQAVGFEWGFMVCGIITVIAAIVWLIFGRETLEQKC